MTNITEARREYIEGVGRRKSAIARVRIISGGTGVFLVNDRPWDEYFTTVRMQKMVRDPFESTGTWGDTDVSVHVSGGGPYSQAGAVRLGAARALVGQDEERRALLRDSGMLTRDPRVKERKKPGLKRARRAPQWQKR